MICKLFFIYFLWAFFYQIILQHSFDIDPARVKTGIQLGGNLLLEKVDPSPCGKL